MKQPRSTAVVVIPAVLIGGLIFAVVSSPLFGAGEWTTGPNQDCAPPSYETDGRSWEERPPAAVELSSDNCVGYCFNAIVETESDEDSDVARVTLVGDDGALTRGVVDRTRVQRNSLTAALDRQPVRFACFGNRAGPEGTPLFDDCVQMPTDEPALVACNDATAATSDDAKRPRTSAFDMFRFGL